MICLPLGDNVNFGNLIKTSKGENLDIGCVELPKRSGIVESCLALGISQNVSEIMSWQSNPGEGCCLDAHEAGHWRYEIIVGIRASLENSIWGMRIISGISGDSSLVMETSSSDN